MLNAASSSRTNAPRGRVAAGLIAVILAMGAAAVVLVVLPSGFFDLDRFTVPKELALLVSAVAAGTILLSAVPVIELGVAELGLLAFLGWSAASAVFAANHWLAARALGVTLGGTMVFFAARFAAGRLGRGAVIGPLALAVLLGAGSGLLQAYGWDSGFLADSRAPGGALGNRNFMAHLAVMGLPLFGWLAARSRGRTAVVVTLLSVMAITAAIVLSRSRAAWVGLGATAATILLGALLTRGGETRFPARRLGAFSGAMALGAALALVLPNRLDWKSSSPYQDSLKDVLNYREGSGHGRLIQYRNSLRLVTANPLLGAGPGNWFVEYPTVTTPGDPSFGAGDPIPTNPWPSSDWVALAVERGPFGVLLWVGTLLCFVVVAFRRARDSDHGAAAIAALGLLAAVSVEGLFDAVLLLAPPTFLCAAALGALLPATRPVRTVALQSRRGSALLLLFAAALPLLARGLGETAAVVATGTGYPVARLTNAVRFDPGNYRLHLHIALRMGCSPIGRYHARRAAELLPNHPWTRRLWARCGG